MAETSARQRRFWLTVGEAAAILAVIIAGLNYWDSHREHEAQARREATQARQTSLAAALTLVGEVQSGGRRLALKPVDPSEVIESQRYVLPRDIVDHPIEVTAQTPGLEAQAVAPGLVRQLSSRRAPAAGTARVPVAIVTTYLAGGEARQDRSLYVVGYAWKRRFMRAPEITLQGLAFRARLAPNADPQGAVERVWASSR
jgi:hypothetical protein